MKRRSLIRAILDCGAVLVREGSSHTIYENPRTGLGIAVLGTPKSKK